MTELQDAWSRRDLAGYLSYWSAEADVVNRGGQRFHGLGEAEQQWSRLFERGYPEIFAAETEVVGVRWVTSDVAVVHQLGRESSRESVAVYVLARQGSGSPWRVEALAIVPIG